MPEAMPTRHCVPATPLSEEAKKRAVVDSIRASLESFHRSIATAQSEISLPQFRRLEGDARPLDSRSPRPAVPKRRPPRIVSRSRGAVWAERLAWALLIGAALYVLAQVPAAIVAAQLAAESPVAQW